ncbi:MAG TPA: putative Ig domain-containing protein [Pseudomonadales bacterium]|jgi:hypothetical protein|nr:putative Ig domain-containing protein [Pseudomonadales bacterium]HNB42929.1 putative Ig domain-containing protein [Burkholderiaceae bacterium]HNL31656.1 putative Ig domain-containing protein [Pseudomonadales bacterium]HNN66773.1 putative Ig domain-containing protein [Pseudomonadales bacterium]
MTRPHRLLCSLLLLLVTVPGHATLDDARAKGIKWLLQNQRGDGSFAGMRGLNMQSTSAAVEAMQTAGLARSPHYGRALTWLANASGDSLDSRAWQVAALTAAGRDAVAIATRIRDERSNGVASAGSITGSVVAWGAYPGYGASTIDTALGYGALRGAGVGYAGDTTDLTITALCIILPAQLASSPWSGAWPQALPQNGQPAHAAAGSLTATTVMLHELKKQRQASRFLSGSVCGKSSPSAVDGAMTSARSWLIAQANGDGGFAERNPQSGALEASTPLATAMAIRALAPFAAEGDAVAATALGNARAWLDAQQSGDGSWRGDPLVTARVLAALPAATGAQLTDSDQDGVTDTIEQQLGTQIMVADAQAWLDPNANAVPGVTTTSFRVLANLNEAFSYSVTAVGGSGPFVFARVNGNLPPGLTMAANGVISGAPTAPGSYAFDYEVTDATDARSLVIGRIDVVPASMTNGDVPLPPWALVLLGAGLFSAMRRHVARSGVPLRRRAR